MTDKLLKLFFPKKNCRAQVLHMDQAWESMVRNQNLPLPVKRMLGEMTAAAFMLAASLKFDGSLVLQLQGDGPVKLALVEVRSGLIGRATAQLRVPAESIPSDISFKQMVNATGKGRCALVLDMAGRRPGDQPYQGVVPLGDVSVAQAVESYMTQSEQIETRLWLASSDISCGGVLLQQVAATGGTLPTEEIDPEGFASLVMIAQTVKAEELLALDASDTATRLFWEDNPKVMDTLHPSFSCRCSRDSVARMVKSLGKEEAESILAERGRIEVRCEFCGSNYLFDKVDIEEMFADPAFKGQTSQTTH
jgi:molecular chaperone Hsp33